MTRPERLGVSYFQPLTQRVGMRNTDFLRLSLVLIIFIIARAFVINRSTNIELISAQKTKFVIATTYKLHL